MFRKGYIFEARLSELDGRLGILAFISFVRSAGLSLHSLSMFVGIYRIGDAVTP